MSSVLGVPAELARAIEAEDATLDALDADVRAVVGRVWCHRSASEMTAALAFSDLARDLFAMPADPAVRFLAARAVTDEITHAEVCRRLASRYLREDVPLPAPRAFEPARFGDCPEPVNRTLRVVLQCCISESLGSAMLGECFGRARPPAVRAVLKFLLTDEIDHGRIGYAYLASPLVDEEHRAHVRRAIPTLLSVAREAWYAPDPGFPESVPEGHGCLARDDLRRVVEDAIANLVLPGLATVGVR